MSDTIITTAQAGNIPTNYQCPPRILLGMCIGVSIYWLFALSMGPLLPSIGKELGVNVPDLALPMSLAGLVSGICIMPAGGLADRAGRLLMTRIGLAAGLAGMLMCGLANSVEWLIAGRFMQGLAAGFIMPATLALVKVYYNDEDRPKAISYWSMSSFGSASVSSLFGGLVATFLGWRWAFLLAAPLIALAFWLLRAAPESKVARDKKHPFDAIGFTVLIAGLLGLFLFVTKGNTWGWSSLEALTALSIFAIALLVFIAHERRHPAPIADLSLFKRRAFTGAVVANLFLNSLLGLLVVLLAYLQKGRGLSALNASLLTLSYTVTVLSLIRVGEKIGKNRGPRLPMVLGALFFTLSALCLASTSIANDLGYFAMAFIGMGCMGTGLGLFATPATNTAVGEAPADKAGAAGGIFKMASSLGGAFGIAIHLAIYGSIARANGGNFHEAAQYALGIGACASVIAALFSYWLAPTTKKA